MSKPVAAKKTEMNLYRSLTKPGGPAGKEMSHINVGGRRALRMVGRRISLSLEY